MQIPAANHFYLQPLDYHDSAAFREAFAFALDKAKELGLERVIILTATKSHTGYIEAAFEKGEAVVAELQRGGKLENGILYKLEALTTYYSTRKDLVLALSMSAEQLFKIEDKNSVNAIVTVPHAFEIEEWTEAWGAFEIRSAQNSSTYPDPSCPVQKGLDRLHSAAHGGTSNSSDQEKMRTLARIIYKYEPQTLAASVGSYLLRKHNWETRHALYVQSLLDKLQQGKTFQGGDKKGLHILYKQWQAECK